VIEPSTVVIVGATAVGKSAAALALADCQEIEIINADSMQGYVGMDIGTAKPSVEQQATVRHHVIDVWPHSRDISVVEFRDAARSAISAVRARGVTPVVVGGSWLYVQAILDDLTFPPTDPDLRVFWEDQLQERGVASLHAELGLKDPAAAESILPNNARRIVRALEVVDLQGSFAAQLPEPKPWCEAYWFGVDMERKHIDDRIGLRVDQMWRSGFVDEVRELSVMGFGRTSAQALGYAQILRQLAGEISEAEAIETTVRATQRFARRQQRRFAQDSRIEWLNGQSGPAEVARIMRQRIAT